jgi:hypothetical protein
MSGSLLGGVLAAALGTSAAGAAPQLEIRGLAGHVVVIPEPRKDIAVILLKAKTRFPVRVMRFGGAVTVLGDLGNRVHGCPLAGGRRAVRIRDIGVIDLEDLPDLVVRTPLDARVRIGGGLYGVIGRSHSLDFSSRGCGAWLLGNVTGAMRLSETGSGAAMAGASGSADLSVAGTGSVAVKDVAHTLTAVSSDDGVITASSAQGPLNLRVAGSGGISIDAGQASRVVADVAGSGAIKFGGVAESLVASVAGPGYISIAKVRGPVARHVMGPGAIQVGP